MMIHRKFLIITIFAIAMGYLESAVVVYLREIYYPAGFAFPLVNLSERIAITEVLREFATLVMLAGIGYLSGKNSTQRFGVFLYVFGIWDIFYYVFLKALIGWPESLLTWDILFLIPVTWVGPVLAPVINALTMCVLGAMIYYYHARNIPVKIKPVHWIILTLGSLIIFISYVQDYLHFIRSQMSLINIFRPSEANEVMNAVLSYVPVSFNWWIFGIGQLMLIAAIALIFRRS